MSNQTQPGFPAFIPENRNICFDPRTRFFCLSPNRAFIFFCFVFTNTGQLFQFFSLFPVFVDFITCPYNVHILTEIVSTGSKLARLQIWWKWHDFEDDDNGRVYVVPVPALAAMIFRRVMAMEEYLMIITDTMVCTGCCATLDHIVTYLFKKVTNKGGWWTAGAQSHKEWSLSKLIIKTT